MSITIIKPTYTRLPQIGGQILDYGNHLTRGLVKVGLPTGRWAYSPILSLCQAGRGIKIHDSAAPSKYPQLPGGACQNGIADCTVFSLEYYTSSPAWNSNNYMYADTLAGWPNDLGVKLLSGKSYCQMNIAARNSGGTVKTASIGDTVDTFINQFINIRPLARTVTVDSTLFATGYRAKEKFGTSTGLQGYSYNPPASGAGAAICMGGILSDDPGTNQFLCLRYNRCLSDSEVFDLHDNPWQIFRAVRRRISGTVSIKTQIFESYYKRRRSQ